MERRREIADENRQRIIEAARELLAAPDSSEKFSVDAVADRAGVARMTVYYQFGSMRGLLEGVCDSLAIAGGLDHLADAFRKPDPLHALDQFIAAFVRFWDTNRSVLRGAMAVLDPDVVAVLEGRSGWRRKGLRVLLDRLAKQTGRPKPKEMEDAVDLVYMLTSFHTYDTLATSKRSTVQVTKLVQRLARAALAGSERLHHEGTKVTKSN
jgi:AcrR family transcriptional regulator